MLPAGTTLGPYKILAPLGAGGMGEVYRARDTRLGRDVAIKVILTELARSPDRIKRFEQEARAAGALNHPNVCAIHDIGTHEGSPFVVMELLDGESLRARLNQGPIPVRKAIEWAAQAAHGLAAAHEKGIVHRDLKPDNLFLTKDGRVKVLDFGLAKLTRPEIVSGSGESSVSVPPTETGIILGTVGYMAPEQVRGEPADHRADLFALGSILYELLTGKRAFSGVTFVETSYRILSEEPLPLSASGREMAAGIEAIVRRCLEKSPLERFQSAQDLAFALSSCGEAGPAAVPLTPGGGRARLLPSASVRGRVVAAAAATLLLAIGATALVTWRLKPVAERTALRASILLPSGTQLPEYRYGSFAPGIAFTQLALSPDAKVLAVCASPDGSPDRARLFLRPLDRFESTPIPGTEGAAAPFFSPDGQWVGFWAQGRLKKWPVAGGLPVTLCECTMNPAGIDWGSDGSIVVGTIDEGLLILDAGRERLRRLTTLDRTKEASHLLPRFLPGGKAILFTVRPLAYLPESHIEALTLASGERKVLIEAGADARFVATGHIVYLASSVLMAVPFDPAALAVRGGAVPMVQGVAQSLNALSKSAGTGAGQYALAAAGTLVFAPGGIFPDLDVKLTWVDRGSGEEPGPALGKPWIASVRLSPDNRYLAYRTRGLQAELWVHDLTLGTSRRITRGGQAMNVCWTPDGKRLTFAYSTAGVPQVYWAAADGSGPAQPELLVSSDNFLQPACWTPDGRQLLFVELSRDFEDDIWTYSREGGQKTPLFNAPYRENYPDVSPDGRFLAFCTNETGRSEVYVAAMADPGRRTAVSSGGGVAPVWAPDGRTIYFWDGTWTKLMAAGITADSRLEVGKPRELFTHPCGTTDWVRPFDISRDGGKFLIPGAAQGARVPLTRLCVAQDWFAELERRCPRRQ